MATDHGVGYVESCQIQSNGDFGIDILKGGNPIVRNCKINRNKSKGARISKKGIGDFDNCDLTENREGAWAIDPLCQVKMAG